VKSEEAQIPAEKTGSSAAAAPVRHDRDLGRGLGHGTILFLVAISLAAHLVMGGIFVFDETPGTDAAWTGFPLDDAWIHMVYSRSLAESGAPCYNDGELENGFTSPLWMILGAIPHLLENLFGLSAVAGVKALGILFGWLASCALMFLVLSIVARPQAEDRSPPPAPGGAEAETGWPFAAAAFSGLALACTPGMIFAEVSGMEISLCAFLMLAALTAYRSGAFLGAGTFAGLAVLARPEAVLLHLGLPVLYLLETLLSEKPRDPRAGRNHTNNLIRIVAPGLILIGLWIIYSLAVTGRPLPNTYYAKYDRSALLDLEQFFNVIAGVVGSVNPTVIAAIAILSLAALSRVVSLSRSKLFVGFILLFGLVYLYAICASRDMPEGCTRFFYWWRYLIPVLPLIWIPAALGIDGLTDLGTGPVARLAARAAAVVLAGVIVIGLVSRLSSVTGAYAWNCQNINEVQVELGKWVNKNLPPGTGVAVNDAGAIRFFGQRRTLDLMSLNRHKGLDERDRGDAFPFVDLAWFFSLPQQFPGNPETSGLREVIGHEVWKKLNWLHERQIEYLVIFPLWFPDLDIASRSDWTLRPRGGQPRLTGKFVKVAERTSPHFTVTEAPPEGKIGQNVKHVYKCLYRLSP
jgi:hypothetical protein